MFIIVFLMEIYKVLEDIFSNRKGVQYAKQNDHVRVISKHGHVFCVEIVIKRNNKHISTDKTFPINENKLELCQ